MASLLQQFPSDETDPELGLEHLQDVLDVLRDSGFSDSSWKELGRRLMPQSVLLDWKTIAERDADPLEDVIDIWLRHGENPSWEKLIKAVTRCRKGGGKNVAKKIRKKVEQECGGIDQSDQQDSDSQQTTTRIRLGTIITTIVHVILFLVLIGVIFGVIFGVVAVPHQTHQTQGSDNNKSAKEYIVYEGDTVLLAEVNETNYKVSIQQMCPAGGGHTIELLIAPNCNLQPHCFNISYEDNVISKKSPTEVKFNYQSHIYMTSSSNITFSVKIFTPMASTSLVIFNNYHYFTDYLHSDTPSTDKALLVHVFQGQNLAYTFHNETDTYFAAFESMNNTDFTFHYSGYVCNYSYQDYTKSECDLPANTCEQHSCPFEYPALNKACILGRFPQRPALPTYAFLQVETYREVTAFEQKSLP